MKILLDNCVHAGVKNLLRGHDVKHAPEVGLESFANGNLLRAAAHFHEVLVTTDKNLRHEQNLSTLPIPVVELDTLFTRLSDLQTLAPFLPAALEHTKRYRFVSVKPDGTFELLGERDAAQLQKD